MLRVVPHLQSASRSHPALCQTPTLLAMRTSLRISRSQVSVKRLRHSSWPVEGPFSSTGHVRLSTEPMSFSHLPSHPNPASFSVLSPLYVPQVTLLLPPAVTSQGQPHQHLTQCPYGFPLRLYLLIQQFTKIQILPIAPPTKSVKFLHRQVAH